MLFDVYSTLTPRSRTMKTLSRICVITSLLLVVSCTKDSNPTGPVSPSPSNKILTGQSVSLGSQTFDPSGGTFTINKPGDTLNGLQASRMRRSHHINLAQRSIRSHRLSRSAMTTNTLQCP
jgi:hypothetical protein